MAEQLSRLLGIAETDGITQSDLVSQFFDAIEAALESRELVDEFRWKMIQALLLWKGFADPRRFSGLARLLCSHIREGIMCLFEVWDAWADGISDDSEAVAVFGVLSTVAASAFQTLPSSQAIHSFRSLYESMHKVAVARGRDTKFKRSSPSGAETLQVHVTSHDDVPLVPHYVSAEQIEQALPLVISMRAVLVRCLALCRGSLPAALPTLLRACYHWIDLFLSSIAYSEGLSAESLQLAPSEITLAINACFPLLGPSVSISSILSQLDQGPADEQVSYGRSALPDSAWDADNQVGVSFICLASCHFPDQVGNQLRAPQVLSPFYVGLTSISRSLPLASCCPKWYLTFLRSAIGLLGQGSLKVTVRQSTEGHCKDTKAASAICALLPPASSVSRAWENIVEIAIKSPEVAVRSHLLGEVLNPLLVSVPDRSGSLVLMSHLIQRCPYSNAAAGVVNLMKEQFRAECDDLERAGAMFSPAVFSSASVFLRTLPHILDSCDGIQQNDVIMACLNFLRYALLRAARSTRLEICDSSFTAELLSSVLEPLRLRLSRSASREASQAQNSSAAEQQTRMLQLQGVAGASVSKVVQSQQRSVAQHQLMLSICDRVIELCARRPS